MFDHSKVPLPSAIELVVPGNGAALIATDARLESAVFAPALPDGVAHVPSPRQNVVLDALVPLFRFVTGRLPVTPVVNGSPVALVSTPDAGVPRAGVTNVGLVANTAAPVPVGLLMTPSSCAEVVEANCDSGLPVTPHVAQAIVPVVVIGPPVIGPVVAMLVTVPLPPPPVP